MPLSLWLPASSHVNPTNSRIGSHNRPARELPNRNRVNAAVDLDGFATRVLAHLEQDHEESDERGPEHDGTI